MRMVPIVKTILLSVQSLKGTYGSIEIFEDRLNAMRHSKEKDIGVKNINKLKHCISINGVSYRYSKSDKDVLDNITFTIKTGEMTAIVGPSGSGKSTLIDLIPRLRHPTKGVIKIDNEDYEEYKLKSIRKLIAYAPQSPHVFNGTIKNHITQGKKNATNEEIQEAVRLSGSEEFIGQLPEGLETIIGEDAVRLSGGQRQRIDLARALVKKAPILILDEPTSNLDAESEEAFKSVLNQLHKETSTTIIIVSHRLASITHSDQIIVLNKGVVEDIAKHNKLLDKKGWYAKAWKAQMSTVE
jgi:subfamily B ATP-binding cassette protein MsbA